MIGRALAAFDQSTSRAHSLSDGVAQMGLHSSLQPQRKSTASYSLSGTLFFLPSKAHSELKLARLTLRRSICS